MHGYYEAKTKKKPLEDEEPREKGKIRSTTRTHGRASRAHDRASLHHGQPVVATVLPGPDAFSLLRFDLFLDLVWALDLHVLGLLCSFV